MTILICIIIYILIGVPIGDSILKHGKKIDPEYDSIVTRPKVMLLILAIVWPIFIIVGMFKK